MDEIFNNKNPERFRLHMPDIGCKDYLLCAAIWFKDGKMYEHQPKNIDAGFVVCGRRHRNCYKTAWIFNKGKVEHLLETGNKALEGYITSDDRFVDRKEGGEIAFSVGQTSSLKDCLFTEDLY